MKVDLADQPNPVPAAVQSRRGTRTATVAAPPRRRIRTSVAAPIITIVALVALWQFASTTELVNPLVMPAPTEVATALVDLTDEAFFWGAVRVTMWQAVAGFAIGAGAGIVLGTLISLIPLVRSAIYPLAVLFQTTPQVALAPLFFVWFGFGLTPRVLFAATTCFFPVLVSVIVGLSTAPADARTLMRSLGASRWQLFRKLQWPFALPVVFGGIRTAVPLALIGSIVGEFVGGNEGMGVLITTFNMQLQMDKAFAVISTLGIVGLVVYRFVEFLDKKIVFWQRSGN
ncbi:ABC transporter permease [Georgenia yuyongxinii]|uniref:ABC transporter permease n=1 Tax=Georgenia yuyongxinii TaxID=2589797 RepID=A0A552WYZ7_9MICO|nr:ABC transporter permease [Georgenia yuyongxinii]TRW47563.1 ABC transporter permease [Georgenia yuyongxinii]